MGDLFPGFSIERIKTDRAEIFARVGGAGPPLLLLHGYPQTHHCWHKIAPALAAEFTVVAADLRGYGQSSAPRGDGGASTYTKRTMAADMVDVMRTLGHDSFAVAGHDRGGRVAYRLALDHPAAVTRIAVLDILPTLEVWERVSRASTLAAYHWSFLAQPYPLPETLIATDPAYFVVHTLEGWTADRDLDSFDRDALAIYKAALEDPMRIHAVCEDYRAGARTDPEHDAADREAGHRIACPTLVLWGTSYVGKGAASPLDIWRSWCTDMRGAEVASGHFLAEENPQATLAALLPFFRAIG
jgi:haloacetate dehalogenase